jgi:hypothetical protein
MRNIMKRVKTGINISLLFIIAMLACACQPTPERTPVVYGGDLEEKLEGSPAPAGAYDAPASWQETLDMAGSDTKIEIDAAIRVPDVTAFPVYKVKPAAFDDARIESLVSYFAKGRDVFTVPEATKAELEAQLILAKKDNEEEWAAELEAMIAAAPETVEAEIITDWSADQSPAGSFLDDDGGYAGLSVSTDIFEYQNGSIELEWIRKALGDNPIGEIAISEEDAVAAAQNMLRELSIDYMVVGSLEKAQLYSYLSNSTYDRLSEEPGVQRIFHQIRAQYRRNRRHHE